MPSVFVDLSDDVVDLVDDSVRPSAARAAASAASDYWEEQDADLVKSLEGSDAAGGDAGTDDAAPTRPGPSELPKSLAGSVARGGDPLTDATAQVQPGLVSFAKHLLVGSCSGTRLTAFAFAFAACPVSLRRLLHDMGIKAGSARLAGVLWRSEGTLTDFCKQMFEGACRQNPNAEIDMWLPPLRILVSRAVSPTAWAALPHCAQVAET